VEKGAIKHRDDGVGGLTGQGFSPTSFPSRSKKRLERRFKDPADPLKLVIVRDMWLTGFDAPCCHTMYIDKPMEGHNLMQAIARVNRVFKTSRVGWWSTTSASPPN
jgi:type I restriction enzyme R subunit